VLERFRADPTVQSEITALETAVFAGTLTPEHAAWQLLERRADQPPRS
jgi:hypothetical protein